MRALVIGASGGIGAALVTNLTVSGADVTALSRRVDGLDVTDEASVARILGQLEPSFHTVFVATGALELHGIPPEKSLRALDPATLAKQFALNAIGPALVIKHLVRLLPKTEVAHIGVLSARVGSITDNHLGGWYSYRAAKAALNQLLHTAAIELTRTHPLAVLAALHPGTVATSLTAKYAGGHPSVAPHVAADNLIAVLQNLTPDQSGGFFDWSGKVVPW
jgi:NAD(P)-dependent dehydrogenase (short-subunit alcohol dehydrogenase family)